MKLLWNFILVALFLELCCGLELVYNIPEQLPVGLFVGNIGIDANLNQDMADVEFENLRYSILSQSNSYFSLNQTSGNLYTDSELDREIICPYFSTCVLTISISVSSSRTSFFTKVNTKVFIDDINDHAPIFPKSMLSLSIPESVLVGTSFTIEGAKDEDRSDAFSLKSYELTPREAPFSLQFIKNIDGTSMIKLIVDGEIDREARDFYRLEITARDGGSPPLTDEMTVDVTVLDVNDNPPMLSSSVYNITVKEETQAGEVIYRLSATDLDLGDNAKVTYRLSNHQSNEIKDLFHINATSGELILKEAFPPTHETSYRVIVEVIDAGDIPLTSQAFVIVTVLDTGNNPPQIIVSLLNPSNSSASISEYAPFGYAVAHINVVDRDSGYNGIVYCSINNPTFELQSFDVNDYKIIVAQPLDREKVSSHQIKIVCQDNGNPPLTKESSFMVHVIDVNDNPPIFTRNHYSGSIDEHNNIGDLIMKVTATDADAGTNSEIHYMLQHGNTTVVGIDPLTGVIRAKSVFDRENINRFEFGVLAVDGGSPPRVGTASVTFIITDINDNAPKFEENLFLFKVKENQRPGTVIGRLFASDKDTGDNAKIVFSLSDGSSSNLPFVVYSDGLIKTTAELDREKRKVFNFTVRVSDLGRPSLNSTARVNVFLEDDNDNSPVILFPSINNNTVSISSGTPPGSVVASILALDPDEGLRGELLYGFDGYNDTGYFKIFSATGDIILQQSVQSFSGKVFTLSIVVSDQGKPARRSLQTLRISIASKSSTNMNVIIVVSIVCVTLVLSAGIILVICVIRRIDANKDNSKKRQSDSLTANGVINNHHNNQSALNNCESSLPGILAEDAMIETERKRKEVTFSFSPDQSVPNGFIFENKANRIGRQASFGVSITMLWINFLTGFDF